MMGEKENVVGIRRHEQKDEIRVIYSNMDFTVTSMIKLGTVLRPMKKGFLLGELVDGPAHPSNQDHEKDVGYCCCEGMTL